MLNPELNVNKAFKEQCESNLENSFSDETIMPINKKIKREHLCSYTSDVLLKQKKHGIQGIEFNIVLYHGKTMYVLIICVVRKKFITPFVTNMVFQNISLLCIIQSNKNLSFSF